MAKLGALPYARIDKDMKLYTIYNMHLFTLYILCILYIALAKMFGCYSRPAHKIFKNKFLPLCDKHIPKITIKESFQPLGSTLKFLD